jgi:hypothetical protein
MTLPVMLDSLSRNPVTWVLKLQRPLVTARLSSLLPMLASIETTHLRAAAAVFHVAFRSETSPSGEARVSVNLGVSLRQAVQQRPQGGQCLLRSG